jgi:hypothetical protein
MVANAAMQNQKIKSAQRVAAGKMAMDAIRDQAQIQKELHLNAAKPQPKKGTE